MTVVAVRSQFTIGRIARDARIHVQTIRFYEREGLLDKPARTNAGYRSYSPQVISRLTFIRHAKEFGFSLHEIRELLALRVASGNSCANVKLRTTRKIAELDFRIASLIHIRQGLAELSAECKGKGPAIKCPLLNSLESEEDHKVTKLSRANGRNFEAAVTHAQSVCGTKKKRKMPCL